MQNQRADARVQKGVKLEDIFNQIQKGEVATLNLVLKADVQGSLEALTESLRKLERDDVKLAFVHRAVGGITENDITLAATTNATIIGFNVRPDRKARELADAEDVEIRTYEIIYQIIEDIERAMVGLLAPEFEEVVTGEAEVREIFRVPRVGAIAGCYVRSGVITRGSKVRFLRDGVIIWKGTHHVAQALQGRRPRGAGGLRVRHRPLRLPGPQAGRHHRDLRGAGDRPDLTSSSFGRRSAACNRLTRTDDSVACSCSPMTSSCTCRLAVAEGQAPGASGRCSTALGAASASSAAEVEHQDQWQRARLGFAVVASSAGLATEIIDKVDRFVWSHPEIEVLSTERRWLE